MKTRIFFAAMLCLALAGCESDFYKVTYDYPLSVSPDGTRIIYQRMIQISKQEFGDTRLLVLNTTTGSSFELDDNHADEIRDAIWVGNDKIYSKYGVFTVASDKVSDFKLWKNVAGYPASFGSWGFDEVNLSHDGTKIVFRAYQESVTEPKTNFWTSNLDFTGLNKLDYLKFSENVEKVKWAYDDQHLVYSKGSGNPVQYYSCDISGTNNTLLTFDNPLYSPDGTKVCFTESGQMYISNTDGTNKKLLDAGTSYIWSPDSKYIYYSKDTVLSIKEESVTNYLVYRIDVGSLVKSGLTEAEYGM